MQSAVIGTIILVGAVIECTIITLNRKQRTINRINHRSTMSQLDDLNTALDTISDTVSKVATEQQTLIDELKTANENPAVDLSGPIAKAQAIAAKLQSIDDLVPDTSAGTTGTDATSTGTDSPAPVSTASPATM